MKNKIIWKAEYGITVLLSAVFAVLYVWSGVQEFPDTVTYVEMYFGREPVYPLFLAGIRWLVGEAYYFYVVVFLQNVLAIYAIYRLTDRIGRIFELHIVETYVLAVLGLIPYLLSPLGTASNMTLTNGIITESITFSLYYILMGLFLPIIYGNQIYKNTMLSFAVTLLLSLTRGQMMPLFLVWMIVAGFGMICCKKYQFLLVIGIMVVFGFALRSGTLRLYNMTLFGVNAESNNASTTFFTNVLYSAKEEDGKNISEPYLEVKFSEMIQKMSHQGLDKETANESLIERIDHHEESHDKIKFDIAELYITWYINDISDFAYDGYERELIKEDIAKELTGYILPASFPSWLETYFITAAGGFIRSVAIVHPILNWYALGIYIIAIMLMFFLFWKNKKSRAAFFMLFVFLVICENVFATSMTIMCLSRYMIYNIALFYIAGLLMLRELWQGHQCAEREKKNGISKYKLSKR